MIVLNHIRFFLHGGVFMEIKWYWPAKMLGLVEDISHEYNDGFAHTRVSARADEVFMYLHLAFPVILFMISFIISFLYTKKDKATIVKKALNVVIILMLIYAVLLLIGIAPYFTFYPQGGGFIDLTVFENIVRGLYFAICAFFVWLGRKAGIAAGKTK